MNRKKTLVTTTLLLFALGLLTVNRFGVTAAPVSPYIMVLPEATLDENLTPGMDYEVSIVTDYAGSDIWSYYFSLTYNPDVLEGISVSNGNLITQEKNTHAYFVFEPGAFDNVAGTLSLTAAYYLFLGGHYDTTSGPGTLAYVTFSVKGYGFADIAFDLSPQTDTKLMGATGLSTYPIIRGYDEEEKIGNGYFDNRIPGDINTSQAVNAVDLYLLGKAYGSTSPEEDINKDGMVNSTDLQLLNSNYGRTQSP